MSRDDLHLDAMLRHLGAAYYDSLHGRAVQADVTRAVEEVAGRIGESPDQHAAAATKPTHHGSLQHHGRFHSRVRDVMTTSVISVDRITGYKEIASLLAKHHIGGVPVLMLGRQVAGMVTDADLVAAAGDRGDAGGGSWPRRHHGGAKEHLLTAEQLMTSPAVTIYPDAPIGTAARTLTHHRIRRLPVVDEKGTLIGIVSRRDLLKLFLRPDAEIARQVTEVVAEVLPDEAAAITVTVHEGVVTLTGHSATGSKDELRLAVRLAADLDGVIDVVDRTATGQPA